MCGAPLNVSMRCAFYILPGYMSSRIVCCVFSTRSSNLFKQVCILHVKRGQVSTLETCQTVPTFDPQPPHWHTGTHRGKPAVDKSVVKSKVSLMPGKGLVVLFVRT